jgi:hypothetical protein
MESIGSLHAENVMCVHNVIQHKVDEGKAMASQQQLCLGSTRHMLCVIYS